MTSTRLRLTAALFPVVLLAAACGGGSDDSGNDRARTIAEPSATAAAEPEGNGDKTLSEAELNAALLTVSDLPTGYKQGETSEDDEDNTDSGSEECDAKFERLGEAEDEEAASAEASFEGPALGSILEQSLESYADEDLVKERFDDVVEVLSECKTFTSTDEAGTKTDLTVGALSFPKLGDDTVALAITGKTPDFEIALNVVIVRLGRNVMSVSQGGLSADVVALEQATRAGFAKLSAATE